MLIENAYADDAITTITTTQEPIIEPDPVQSGFSSLVPFVLIFVVMYFLLIRPQEKKRRELEKLVASIKKGDKVITNSGIFGTITKLNDSEGTVMIEIATNVEIEILKSAISDIPSQREKTQEGKAPAKANTKKPAKKKSSSVKKK